jgi:proteasome assembly chaperone (PAC2) family protein
MPFMSTEEREKVEGSLLLAAWPGMGLVAYKAVDYLIKQLPTQLVRQDDLAPFTALRGIHIEKGRILPVKTPTARLYTSSASGRPDLLLYLGEEQPVSGKEWAFVDGLLESLGRFGVKRIYTFAAMPTDIDHRAEPKVWTCATDATLLQELGGLDVQIMQEGTVTGLNGLLLGVAAHRGISGCCLLGEIPTYMTQMENPRSTAAVLERLVGLTGISVDLTELRMLAQATAAQIDVFLQQIQKSMQPGQTEDDEGEGAGEMN